MPRHRAAVLSVAVLLAGGAALAQSDLIVDPWQRALARKASPPPAVDARKAAPAADDGWFEPVADRAAPKPFLAPWPAGESLPDPWVRRAPAPVNRGVPAPAAAPVQTARTLHPSQWARVLPEIIDPWGPARLAAYRDPLIVDPWAR